MWAADDRAFAVLPPRPRARVLLVSDGNLYLEGALLLDEAAVVDKIAPREFGAELAARHDLVVFDRFTPPAPPPVPALYLDPRGTASPFSIRGELRSPIITSVARHPLTRFVSLADLNVTSASRFGLAPGDVTLASSLSDPIWVARERPVRMAALGFDVRRSDLPLRVAFPVMLVDAIDWLSGADRLGETEAAAITGTTVRVPIAGGRAAREVVARAPDGSDRRVPVVGGAARLRVDRAGFYAVEAGGTDARPEVTLVAANLDPAESRIAPVPVLAPGGRAIPLPDEPRPTDRSELFRRLALAAMALLVIEWFTFHRRVTE